VGGWYGWGGVVGQGVRYLLLSVEEEILLLTGRLSAERDRERCNGLLVKKRRWMEEYLLTL
jgi:hypothetical protein